MPDQQYNLYNQPPQSSPPTEQPASEPPKSNKLWPINWGHNKFFKIIGLVLFIISILYFSFLIYYTINPNDPPCLGTEPKTICENGTCSIIFPNPLCLRSPIFSIIFFLKFALSPIIVLFMLLLVIKRNKIDMIDKKIIIYNFIILIIGVLFAAFFLDYPPSKHLFFV